MRYIGRNGDGDEVRDGSVATYSWSSAKSSWSGSEMHGSNAISGGDMDELLVENVFKLQQELVDVLEYCVPDARQLFKALYWLTQLDQKRNSPVGEPSYGTPQPGYR